MLSVSASALRSALRGCTDTQKQTIFLASLKQDEAEFLLHDWVAWARQDQLPPPGDWLTWLILGGRGAGKTRAGAEWVKALALGQQSFALRRYDRIALIGQTGQDVREVMVEGVSGLLSVHGDQERPRYEPSRKRITWPNGAVAELFSAEEPDSLRGPQFGAAWSDELCKWRQPEKAWDMLQFGLRLDAIPRQLVTTTPRPIKLLKKLMQDPDTRVAKVSTRANAHNLAPAFLHNMVQRYQGTRLGRQELDAEILTGHPDALWPRALLDTAQVRTIPQMVRIVIGVDPPASSSEKADACGIVAVGLGEDGHAYVLADETASRLSPSAWASRVALLFRKLGADRVVVEVNQGGEMAQAVLRQIDPELPITAVHARRGKWLRAEPVAALYEQGRVFHAGHFPKLEDEMSDFAPSGLSGGHSPDRVDALVWALTALMLNGRAPEPRLNWL